MSLDCARVRGLHRPRDTAGAEPQTLTPKSVPPGDQGTARLVSQRGRGGIRRASAEGQGAEEAELAPRPATAHPASAAAGTQGTPPPQPAEGARAAGVPRGRVRGGRAPRTCVSAAGVPRGRERRGRAPGRVRGGRARGPASAVGRGAAG